MVTNFIAEPFVSPSLRESRSLKYFLESDPEEPALRIYPYPQPGFCNA